MAISTGLRRYRRFRRWQDRFLAVLPWLWFGGIAAILATFLLPPDPEQRALRAICALTIYPAIVGWLGSNGVGLVWGFALSVRSTARKRAADPAHVVHWRAAAFAAALAATGVLFVGLALALTVGLLRDALAR